MITRLLCKEIINLLQHHAVVGILGPRQVGKTTLAFSIAEKRSSVYLDLESPIDRAKLTDPEMYFHEQGEQLIILDEIQQSPNLFRILRVIIDAKRRQGHKTGQFLILGSASIDLLKQSAVTLAGRIIYTELSTLSILELKAYQPDGKKHWVRGGFPESYLASSDKSSLEWRQGFIKTYLERDIPQLGPRIPAETLRRFWTMLAHNQSELFNASKLAAALGVSSQTVTRYLDLLVDLMLVRRLPAWSKNTGKRLVKSPKTYVRDSGLVHALLSINHFDDLLAHPVAGSSWEGYVIENLLSLLPSSAEAYFYRTSAGAEIDLIIEFKPNERWAIEIKRSLAPKLEKGFYTAYEDIKPHQSFLVYPGNEQFSIAKNTQVISLPALAKLIYDRQ